VTQESDRSFRIAVFGPHRSTAHNSEMNTPRSDKDMEAMESGAQPEPVGPSFLSLAYLGTFLTFINLPTMILAFIVFLLGMDWSSVPVRVAMGLEGHVEETPASKSTLNIHSIMGIGVTLLATLQVSTALIFMLRKQKQAEEEVSSNSWTRIIHRKTGRFTAIVWFLCCIMGLVASLLSVKIKERFPETMDRIVHIGMLTGSGVFSCVNLYIGIRAVTGEIKDYASHKVAMFFMMFWILNVGIGEFFHNLAQLFWTDCSIGTSFIYMVTIAVGDTCFLVFLWKILPKNDERGTSVLYPRLVKGNMILLGLRVVMFWGVGLFLLFNPANDIKEYSCFARNQPDS